MRSIRGRFPQSERDSELRGFMRRDDGYGGCLGPDPSHRPDKLFPDGLREGPHLGILEPISLEITGQWPSADDSFSSCTSRESSPSTSPALRGGEDPSGVGIAGSHKRSVDGQVPWRPWMPARRSYIAE